MATLEIYAHQEVQGPGRVWKFLKHSVVSERLGTSSLIWKVGAGVRRAKVDSTLPLAGLRLGQVLPHSSVQQFRC